MKIRVIFFLLLIVCCSYSVYGQKKAKKVTISGNVVDANNKPVEGAAVFIDKVKTNSVTDKEGTYKVKVNADAKEILIFTLFNGASEELIDGRTSIDFILNNQSAADEVNIKTAGNEITKSASDASVRKDVSAIDGKIDGRNPAFASYTNIYDMIRGRFPGVVVTGHSIKMEGSSSLNVSTEPLFVVDGVIVNSIDGISPATVKYIEVLKGPEASVYGMRGANGVIVITRISGKDK